MKSKTSPRPPRLGFVISDLHCGSTVGLLPPGFVTLEGQAVKQNPVQEWLWKCWSDAHDWMEDIADGDPFFLVLNGDLIDGNHHRTTQIISPDVGDHVEAAIHSLRGLTARSSATFIIKGTECHTHNAETVIGKALKTRINEESGLPSWDRLSLDVNGVRCVFRHHIGTTTRRGLAGTQLSMQLAEEQVEAANAGEPIPRVLCCAHRHKPGHYQDNNGACVVTGAWQDLTRFAHKVVSQARCTPSVAALDFRNLAPGELPRIHSRTYEPQKTKAVAL